MKHLLLLLAIGLVIDAQAQRKSPHDTVSFANGEVTYGRPYKNNRDIFGGLEKFGTVWRVGADEATTITLNEDTKFGGQAVPKGTYTMFALINEKEWTIILNSQLGQWGSYRYNQFKDKDVAKVTVPVKKLDKVVEQLTIRFNKENSMIIEWDMTQVVVPMSF